MVGIASKKGSRYQTWNRLVSPAKRPSNCSRSGVATFGLPGFCAYINDLSTALCALVRTNAALGRFLSAILHLTISGCNTTLREMGHPCKGERQRALIRSTL